MITEAERKYDEDYQVIRRMLMQCNVNDKLSLLNTKIWIKERGIATVHSAEAEINSKMGSIRRQLSRPSFIELREQKELEDMFGDDE